MYKRQYRLIATAAFCLASSTDAFRSQTNVARHRQTHQRAMMTLHHQSHNFDQRDSACDQKVNNSEEGRRLFLKKLSTVMTGTVLLPSLSFAEEEEEEEDEKTPIEKVESISKDEIEPDAVAVEEGSDENDPIVEDNKTPIDQVPETVAAQEGSDENDPIVDDNKTPIDQVPETAAAREGSNENDSFEENKIPIDQEVYTLIEDESELDAEVMQEEADEKKSIEDEKQLIDELEKEITIEEADSSTTEEVEKEADIIKGETESLIKEEELLKSETEEMITKIEAMESEVQALEKEEGGTTDNKTEAGGDGGNGGNGGSDATKEKESEAFVDKLKERVEQKDDLITRLKRQSEKDVDPKTGKFKTMTAKEYKERVKSTDTDFIQFLKDTVANEQEWEQDLEAFEGFLDKEFGPTVKQLRKDLKPIIGEVEKDLKPIVGEMENEFQKEVAPAVGDMMQQLKDKATSAVDSEAEDLKKRADGLIGKLRSIF